jgi:stage II sporulation protein M
MTDSGLKEPKAGMRYRWWLIIAIALFAIGVAFGLADPFDIAGPLFDEIQGLLGTGQTEGLGGLLAPFSFIMFIFIFIKNVITLLFSFGFAPVFCIVPVITLVLNGWLVGAAVLVISEQESLGYVLAGLLPHGVIELPALFIGEAAALSMAVVLITALFKKEKRGLVLPGLKQNLKYLAIAVGLMLPAAAIETFVTPLVIGL